MKKRILTAVVACFLVTAFCLTSSAGTKIDTCKLVETVVSPARTVYVTFAPTGLTNVGAYAGVYHLDVEHYLGDPPEGYYGELLGFCIEGTYSPTSLVDYGIWTIDDDGGAYEMAAWLADHYFSGPDTADSAAAHQVAIWEAVYDPDELDLTKGNFILNSASTAVRDGANTLLTSLGSADLDAFSPGGWNLAVSPPSSEPGANELPQDYIVPNIPEPGTMLLLGTGLLGIYGYARRKRSSRTAP